MKILAHRGLNKFPENSLKSIKTAVNNGFGIEIDFRMNRDKEFILIHDDNTVRLFGKNMPVSQIRNRDVPEYVYLSDKSQRLIFFNEIIKYLDKASFFDIAIHFKEDCQNDEGIRLLSYYYKNFNLYNKAFVFDISLDAALKIRSIDSNIPLAFILSENKFDRAVYLWDEIKEKKDLFDVFWLAEYQKFYTPDLFKEISEFNKPVYAVSPEVHRALGHPYAISGYEKIWNLFIKYEIDGICTDYPNELRKYANNK